MSTNDLRRDEHFGGGLGWRQLRLDHGRPQALLRWPAGHREAARGDAGAALLNQCLVQRLGISPNAIGRQVHNEDVVRVLPPDGEVSCKHYWRRGGRRVVCWECVASLARNLRTACSRAERVRARPASRLPAYRAAVDRSPRRGPLSSAFSPDRFAISFGASLDDQSLTATVVIGVTYSRLRSS